MSFVSINNSKGGAPDGRVDRILQDCEVTRVDIGQVVAWLQELDEKVSAVKVPEATVDVDARQRLSQYADHLSDAWDAIRTVEDRADSTKNQLAGWLEDHSAFVHGIKEDIGCLQSIVKRLQEQPPQQIVQVYHNHTYTPESHRLMWWAIGFTFLIGALSYAV